MSTEEIVPKTIPIRYDGCIRVNATTSRSQQDSKSYNGSSNNNTKTNNLIINYIKHLYTLYKHTMGTCVNACQIVAIVCRRVRFATLGKTHLNCQIMFKYLFGFRIFGYR